MSIVFESGHRSSFLADESYPNIDQASEEVERYDEADGSNDVSDVMHDVGDLGVAVTVSYHPPEQPILAESEPSRVLDVVEDIENVENVGEVGQVGDVAGVVGDNNVEDVEESHPHGLPGPSDMNSAAAAAVASIAAAEAEVARAAAAAAAAQHNLSATQAPQQPTSLASLSPDSMKETSPSSSSLAMAITPQRVKPIAKPDREVQKNGQGMYQCTWTDCNEETTTFSRKCEYNKHMDKHERPYRCVADGCQKLPGFTYSGGLLRHEREVHGKHGGPRNPLHCPHQTCKRHSGKGFSRAENLNEHLRRVHTPGHSLGNDAPIMASILGHVTTASAANGIVSTTTASASAADALLAHPTSGLININNLSGLTSVLRSLPVLPSSPAASGKNGVSGVDDVGDLSHVNGMSGTNGANGANGANGDGNNNNSAAAVAAAAAAAAAAAFSGVAVTGVDNDNAKTMEESLNMLLNESPSATTQSAADPTSPRGRKRSAAAMMAGDGLSGAALASTQHLVGGDYHDLHLDLREEMKRLRQENQEQRKQLDQQKQQTTSLIMQISALRQLIAGQHQQ